jgi:hypothetical protein
MRQFFYAIRREALDEMSVYDVLDMLRYDAATPVEVVTSKKTPTVSFYVFRTQNESSPSRNRWRSHGVSVISHFSMSIVEVRDVLQSGDFDKPLGGPQVFDKIYGMREAVEIIEELVSELEPRLQYEDEQKVVPDADTEDLVDRAQALVKQFAVTR